MEGISTVVFFLGAIQDHDLETEVKIGQQETSWILMRQTR